MSALTKQKKGTYSFHSVTFPLECTSNGLHRHLDPKNLMKLSLQFRKSHVVMFLDYSYATHTQIIIGTAPFLFLDPFIKVLSLILYYFISNLSYHCTI